MAGLSKLRYLVWTDGNREIFAGNDNGKITVWDANKGQSIFVLEAHDTAITKMQWFEKSRYLMTASKEKSLCIWEVPKVWIQEEVPDGKQNDEEAKFKTMKLKEVLEEHKDDDSNFKYAQPEANLASDTTSFANMNQGLDPLGGGQIKANKMNTDDDDLLGWNN